MKANRPLLRSSGSSRSASRQAIAYVLTGSILASQSLGAVAQSVPLVLVQQAAPAVVAQPAPPPPAPNPAVAPVARQIRAQRGNVPFLISTGLSDLDLDREGLGAPLEHLQKPFPPDELIGAMLRLLAVPAVGSA